MKKLLPFLSLLLFLACEENDKNPDDCLGETICTLEFRTLSLFIEENGEPLALSSYEVLNLDKNITYELDLSTVQLAAGYFPVITDSEVDEVKKDGTNHRLIGKRPDGTTFEVDFVAGHDCCHVKPISGPFAPN